MPTIKAIPDQIPARTMDKINLKNQIRRFITNYVNHRSKMFEARLCVISVERFNAVSRIKNYLGYYQKSDLTGHLRMIRILQNELLLIMPGEKSVYFKRYNELLNQLFLLCQAQNI